MAWYALTESILETAGRTDTHSASREHLVRPSFGLGSATAHTRWRWTSPLSRRAPATNLPVTLPAARERHERHERHAAVTKRVHVSRELRAEMAQMARALGRSEDEIWAEAAREWLLRRMRNDEPPPTTPAAASLPNPRTRRMWSEIDAMLAELRHPRYIAAPSEPNAPAA
jgi:hypothetical protein